MKKLIILTVILNSLFISKYIANDVENILELNGIVYEMPDVIEGCNIIVHQNGAPSIFTKTDETGKYSLKLALGSDYVIEFTHPGYTTKKISVNAKNNSAQQSYVLNEVVTDLFQELQKKQDVIDLNQPIAKISFNEQTNAFEYDMEYNDKIQKKVQQLWNTVYSERIVRDENYVEAMDIADSSFNIMDYPIAKAGYVNALSYRPMAAEPKKKIKIIDSLLVDEVDRVLEAHSPKEEQAQEEMTSNFEPVEIYSDKIIENVYNVGKKVITLRKVNASENPKSVHYRRVETSFGVYYFKNNTPITSIIWEIETELARK